MTNSAESDLDVLGILDSREFDWLLPEAETRRETLYSVAMTVLGMKVIVTHNYQIKNLNLKC